MASRTAPTAAPPRSRFEDVYPNSGKVYIEGRNGVRVPVREITLSGGEPPLRVYDTSGPQDVDVRAGLPKLRRAWVLGRGDVELVRTAETGTVPGTGNGAVALDRAIVVSAAPAVVAPPPQNNGGQPGQGQQIVGTQSGRCVDVPGTPAPNGTQAHLWDCYGGANQQFRLADSPDGYVRLINRNSNKAVQVQNAIERVQAALAARDLAQQQLDAENSKFSVGMSTNFQVVQAQRDLATAQNNELQAILAYRRAVVEFERVQQAGTAGNITVISR